MVVVSYLRTHEPVRVYHLLTDDAAREFWARLPQPLRETAIIAEARDVDISRGARTWCVSVAKRAA